MPTFIAPSFAPNAAASSASSTASGPRGRNADEADGRSFNAVLTRSRGAGQSQQSQQAQEEGASTALEAKGRHRSSRAGDRKDELPAELLPLAFFTPTMPALASTPAAASALAAGTTAAAAMPESGQGLLVNDAASAALPADVATDAAPVETAEAKDVEGEGPAPAALSRDVQALASETAQPKNKGGAETAIALPAAPSAQPATAGVAAGPAGAPVAGAVSASDAAAATVASVAGGQAKGAGASVMVGQAQSAPAASTAAAAGDKLDFAAAASDAAEPSLVPQAATFAMAATDRANQPATPSQVPVLNVAPPVGSEEWAPAVGHQMLRMNAAGAQVAELNLNPAGLGPLKVTLSMGDNQAQAMFVSAHESVRKAVEAALPQLRASLAEQGISLGQASVGAEAHRFAGQGGAFGQQPQQQGSARQPEYPAPGRAETAALAEPLHGGLPRATPRTSSAGVDTFA
ncbi:MULTISPECIES: flagellar hook-length control protein FliK [Variovorax]|uniref:flagellar hook-length control protein FliK n=1 Tax=Variovorax TaxID=34072 RepID=UPI00285D7F82|nr:flagellar hook-length control protein FliK [Variovorax sp. 3319]MDR6890169.1 flagellar hook-length control protein FliK [Variovorax sp. 3319]